MPPSVSRIERARRRDEAARFRCARESAGISQREVEAVTGLHKGLSRFELGGSGNPERVAALWAALAKVKSSRGDP